MSALQLLAALTALQAPPASAFTGAVHSADGRPVAGAEVVLCRMEGGEARAERLVLGQVRPAIASTRTAPDGTFRLEAALGVAHVEVRASGFAPRAATAIAGEPVPLDLKPAKLRKGAVRGSGRPLDGAILVWIGSGGRGDAGPEAVVKTGRDGAYEVPDPDAWAGEVVILHRDFAVAQAHREGPGWPASLRHELEAGKPIEGKVVAAGGARAIGGATLWLDGWPVGRTAADGTFLIPHAAPGWRMLVAKATGLVGVAKPGTGRISISLQPGPSVAGTVRDSRTRAPIPGAIVTLAGQAGGGSATAVTDERGRYELAQLAPDRYWPVSVAHAGYAPHAGEYDQKDMLDLRRTAARTRDFVLTRLGRLLGRVQDEAQRPIANALVMLVPRGWPTVYSSEAVAGGSLARSSADGSFALSYDPAEVEDETDRALLVLKDGYAATRLEGVNVGAGARPLVVTLARGVVLSGRVLGEDGAPLPDVAVLIAEDSAVGGAMMPAHALLARLGAEGWVKTGPDGLFRAHVRPGLHDLSFRKPGHSPKVVAAQDPAAALEVSLAPSAALRGIVVRHDGRGVSNVAIFAAQPGGARASTRSADDGTFALEELAPGSYDLYVMKENTGISARRRGEAPASDLRIELGPLGALRGRVLDAKTGAPVTSFTVAASRDGGDGEGWEGRAAQEVSDAAGAFVLEDVPVGDVSVTVQAEGYLRQETQGVVSLGGEEGPPLEIALEAGVPLHGRVTSTAGEPLADAQVSVAGGDADSEAGAETDEKGNYRLAGVRPGTVTVQFQLSGYVTLRKSFDTADTTRADAVLARGLSLSGVVTSGGAGVPRAHVAATSSAADAQAAYASSGEGGAFTLDGLTPGRYTIKASSQDGGEAMLESVDVETSGPVRLVLERKPTAVLSGSVTGLPPGDPDVMVRVMVSGEDGRSAHAPVDARGAFRVEKAPAGRVRAQAHASSSSGSARSSRVNELTLAPASESQTVLEFSSDVIIAGRLTRDGAPAAGAAIFFHAQDATGNMASARATESGDYEIVGVEPGLYSVTVSDTGFSYSTEYLVRESARFDVDATGASVRGSTVDAADGAPIGGVDVSFWREGESRPTTSRQANAKGEFAVRSLREGRYRLVTSKQGYGQEVREVDLEPGASAEVVLALSASDGLGLSVVDARDNRPLDATVVVRDLTKRVVANQHSGVGVDGTLTIPLAPGRYLLSTSAGGYGTATVPVTAPARGVRVGLTPGGTLVLESERDLRGRVRLVRPDGEEYVRCWCNGIADIQLTGRHTRVANVTAGSYTVELVDHAGVATRGPTVVIEEGRTATVEIE